MEQKIKQDIVIGYNIRNYGNGRGLHRNRLWRGCS